MKKETHEKLIEAIRNHIDAQDNEDNKANLQEIMMEISNMDMDSKMEKAVQSKQDNIEKRGKE